jgi:hypothetical protein
MPDNSFGASSHRISGERLEPHVSASSLSQRLRDDKMAVFQAR